MSTTHPSDEVLFETFLGPVRKCAGYMPAFGQGRSVGLDYNQFKTLYSNDPFYYWLGLTDPSVYAAHKAAGGLTSVYRQIGVGVERVFRQVLQKSLSLGEEEIDWSYEYTKPSGKSGTHSLDARVSLEHLAPAPKQRFQYWLNKCQAAFSSENQSVVKLEGAVFEVRQGYKSADSKRQNADLRYGMRAYQAGLLPVFSLMSTQVSLPVVNRYRKDGMIVLVGELSDDETTSTFAFFKNVVGYDLAGFFARTSSRLCAEVRAVTEELLQAK